MITQILRDIKKLIIDDVVTANYVKWKVEKTDIQSNVQVLFPDGIIAVKSDSKIWVSQFQSDNYGIIVDNATDLIKKYQLQVGDVFIGRDSNYILFRDGSIIMKTDNFNLECNNFNLECEAINIAVENNIALTVTNLVVNGITFSFAAGKASINTKEIAVVGGTTLANVINNSGQ